MSASTRPLVFGWLALIGLVVADVRQGLGLLDIVSRGALLGAGLFLLIALWRAGLGDPWKGAVVGSLLFVLGALGIGLAGDVGVRRDRGTWEARSRNHLLDEAGRLEDEFARFVGRVGRPAGILAADPFSAAFTVNPAPEPELFELVEDLRRESGLEDPRFGLTLVDGRGEPVGWSGATSIPDRSLYSALFFNTTAVLVADSPVATRFFHLSRVGDSGNALVVEYLVSSRIETAPLDHLFPSLADKRERWDLRFLDFRQAETDLEEVFRRHQDRYWGGFSGARNTLIFPLRSGTGQLLAVATLRAPQESRSLTLARRRHAGAAAGLMALALGILLLTGARHWSASATGPGAGRRRRLATLAWLPVLSVLLWTIRLVLSRGAFPHGIWELEAFDFSNFASRRFFDLVSSPADLALTASAVLGQAALLGVFLHHAAALWRSRLRRDGGDEPERSFLGSGIAVLILLGLGFSLGHAFGRVTRHVVTHTRIDLLAVPFTDPGQDRLLILSALLLFLLAGLWLLAAAVGFAGTGLRWPGLGSVSPLGLPAGTSVRVMLLPAVGVATLILYPILLHAHSASVTGLFENNLLPQVLDHEGLREAALVRSMETVAGDSTVAEALALGTVQDGTGFAFDTWFRTALADEGFASSLLILDAQGIPVGQFSMNMPFLPNVSESGLPPEAPRTEVFQSGSGEEPMLHASVNIRYQGAAVGAAVFHVRDIYSNLPFLTSVDLYTRIFRGNRSRGPEQSAGPDPVLFVYDRRGEPITGTGTAPPLPAQVGFPMPPGQWHRVTTSDGTRLNLLYSAGPGVVFALGYAATGWLDRIGTFVRLLLLFEGCSAILLALAFLLTALPDPARLHPRTLLEYLGRSYYRKLFASFVTASLLPLLALAVFLEGMVNREIRKEITAQGRNTLEASRSILASAAAQGVAVDDAALADLKELFGQDMHLYVDETLLATSRRELVSAGLLSAMLSGAVYRPLVLEGQAFFSVPEDKGSLSHTLVAAPLPSRILGGRATLTLPVGLRPGEVEARVAQVGEAILIATVLLIVLLALTGYVVARRFASPVRRLVRATGLLAGGQLDIQVKAETRDETARLVYSFNAMARAMKDQQEALRQERDYIEKILLNATTGVVTLEGDTIVKINPAAAQMLDRGRAPCPGDHLGELLAATPALQEMARSYQDATRHRDVLRRFEATVAEPADTAGNGEEEERRLRAVLLPFAQEQGQPSSILLLEDITDVARSNRLLAWAEMARRIAHEIKNPLTPIQLSAEHLKRLHGRLGPDCLPDEFAEALDECTEITLEQVEKLREISGEFSLYARIPQIRMQPTDPVRILDEVLRPYAATLPDTVSLERSVEPGLPAVPLDADLMKRILVNLLENSLQAMPDGGKLSVSAGRCRRNGRERLELTIADTGVGMSPEELGKVFEPYFSTKAGGTGLGLAIARKAVEEHGGEIRAESHVGEGTTLRIWIPLEPGE